MTKVFGRPHAQMLWQLNKLDFPTPRQRELIDQLQTLSDIQLAENATGMPHPNKAKYLALAKEVLSASQMPPLPWEKQ